MELLLSRQEIKRSPTHKCCQLHCLLCTLNMLPSIANKDLILVALPLEFAA